MGLGKRVSLNASKARLTHRVKTLELRRAKKKEVVTGLKDLANLVTPEQKQKIDQILASMAEESKQT